MSGERSFSGTRARVRVTGAVAAVALSLAGCFLAIDKDELTGGTRDDGTTDRKDGEADGPHGGDGPDGASSSGGDGATEDGSNDAGSTDADADAGVRCPAAKVSAMKAFDLGLDSGTVCAPENALVDDGKVAGLDRFKGGESTLDGKSVTSCVAVDFERVVRLTGATVHAAPLENACGATPCAPIDAGCGSGHRFSVFTGLSKDALKRGGVVFDTSSNGPSLVPFDDGLRDVAILVVCREGWGTDRDDIAIDYLGGVCE